MHGIGMDDHDQEGRVLTLEFENFYVVTCYTPNSGNGLKRLDYREEWDKAFTQFIAGLDQQKPVMVCGDLNVAHRDIDLARPKANYNKQAGYTQMEIDGMDNLLGIGLKDTFREKHPDTVKYSWWSFRMNARERNVGWRIDYVLCSERLMGQVSEAFILNEIEGSDHCPVGIALEQ
jgi:exodeoxyribonuclease-3